MERYEDLGICVGCGEKLRVGDVVTPWDDEVGHARCDDPSSLKDPDLPEGTPPPVVLIGNPALYIPLREVQRLRLGRGLKGANRG